MSQVNVCAQVSVETVSLFESKITVRGKEHVISGVRTRCDSRTMIGNPYNHSGVPRYDAHPNNTMHFRFTQLETQVQVGMASAIVTNRSASHGQRLMEHGELTKHHRGLKSGFLLVSELIVPTRDFVPGASPPSERVLRHRAYMKSVRSARTQVCGTGRALARPAFSCVEQHCPSPALTSCASTARHDECGHEWQGEQYTCAQQEEVPAADNTVWTKLRTAALFSVLTLSALLLPRAEPAVAAQVRTSPFKCMHASFPSSCAACAAAVLRLCERVDIRPPRH
jgi:hypothetical protein